MELPVQTFHKGITLPVHDVIVVVAAAVLVGVCGPEVRVGVEVVLPAAGFLRTLLDEPHRDADGHLAQLALQLGPVRGRVHARQEVHLCKRFC